MAANVVNLERRIAGGRDGRDGSALIEESAWRRPPPTLMPGSVSAQILVTRWRDRQANAHRHVALATDCCVIALCLAEVAARLRHDGSTLYEGALAPGAMLLMSPDPTLTAEFGGPCDFLHIYLAPTAWRRRVGEFWGLGEPTAAGEIAVVRDSLAEQLARSLLRASDAGQQAYGEAVANAVVARYLLLTRTQRSSGQALQSWRLRRVQTHVEANLAEPLRLAELASIAGLSRMHFAAQFRAATGYRPHEYLLWRRIERAKAMLRRPEPPVVQVALDVGFQAQAHFTTVFKRLTGDTPASWRLSQRADATASAATS